MALQVFGLLLRAECESPVSSLRMFTKTTYVLPFCFVSPGTHFAPASAQQMQPGKPEILLNGAQT